MKLCKNKKLNINIYIMSYLPQNSCFGFNRGLDSILHKQGSVDKNHCLQSCSFSIG